MAGMPDTGVLTSVRGYASDAVGCSPDRFVAASRFQGGNRYAVYKVSYLDAGGAMADVVVRVSFDDGPTECAQAALEAAVLEKVGGLAAPLLYDFRCTIQWFDTPAM